MLGTRTNEKMSPSAFISSTWHFSRIENWWNSLIQMQTRMVAERSRRLNRVCVEGTRTKSSEKKNEGKSERGIYIAKHRLTCFSGFWFLTRPAHLLGMFSCFQNIGFS